LNSGPWGADLAIVTPCDTRFLPGFFALFNSALMNGFAGRFKLLLPEGADTSSVPSHPRLDLLRYRADADVFAAATKAQSLVGLPAGSYLMLDADFIVERPCGDLLKAIDAGLVVSTEAESKYDDYDVFVFHQSVALGVSPDLPAHQYVNGGFLGFQVPRDLALLREYGALTADHLKGSAKVGDHVWFKFLEQDVLNILLRKYRADGGRVFSLSSRTIEIGPGDESMRDRPFPYTRQRNRMPPDRIKYFIHGASLRRPWLPRGPRRDLASRIAATMEDHGVAAMYRKLGGRLTAYERAWAYYACANDCPIPVRHWADRHGFTAYQNPLWRAAYGLRAA
jgi:hypothetical protein